MNPERKRKILLVEDDPVAAAITSAMLKHNGYDVVTVSSGTRAIERIGNDSSIELILMDIDLGPGMSGPDAAREILKTNDIPIVFLTSHSEREMVYKVRAITRYGYVIKNSGDFVLLSSIEMAFELFESHMKLKKTSERLAESEQSTRRKLDSILMPEIDSADIELADLINKDELQPLIDRLYSLTGIRVGVGIIDMKGRVLVESGWQDICKRFHRVHPDTLKHCIESDTLLSAGVKEGEYKVYKCKNNIYDIATPIMIEGKHVGNIFLGQFFFEEEVPDEEIFRKRAAEFGFNGEEYIDAWRSIPRLSRDAVYKIMDYYTELAGLIKKLSYSNIRLARALGERDRAYEKLKKKDTLLNMISDSMTDLIFIMDVNGRYKYVSPSFFRILGYSPEELEGRHSFEYVHSDDLPAVKSAVDVLFVKGTVKVESRYRNKYGNYAWYETSANVIHDSGGNITGAVVAGRDISERREAAYKLEQSDKRYKLLIEKSPLSIFLIREGRYIYSNPSAASRLGYSSPDEMIGLNVENTISPENGELIRERLRNAENGNFNEKIELFLLKKDGSPLITESLSLPISLDDGPAILVIGNDVTRERRMQMELEKSEEKYRTIADFTYDWEFWIGADGKMEYVSPSCEDISGYTASEFMEKAGLLSEIVFPEDSDSPCLNYGSVFESPVTNETEFRITARNGEVRWIAHVCRSVYDREGRFIGRRGSNRDITEKKKSEMEIQNLLEQKEMLLREVHHRIKNNMNTVAGLLKLQSMSIEEPAAIEALNDARGRVQNMMLIYDRLYRSADYKNLNVRDYFENLLNEIIKLFPNHSKVNVVKKIDDFNLDSKVLFTMGIMINELITNTFKYAFDETDNPELAFSLSFIDGRVSFAVKDNGLGLPDKVKSGNRNGFGLNLVSSLAEQLEGEMVFGNTPGTEIKVSFML
jgi:hypothetical protein